jgi:hypothetical protein
MSCIHMGKPTYLPIPIVGMDQKLRETETENEWYQAFGQVSPRWRVNQATAITAAADDMMSIFAGVAYDHRCYTPTSCERGVHELSPDAKETPMATNLPHHLDPLHIRSSVDELYRPIASQL